DFVGTIHSITSFCEVLLRTVLTSVLPTRFGKSTALILQLHSLLTSLRLLRPIFRIGRPTVELTHRSADPLGQHHLDSASGPVEHFIQHRKLLLAHRRQ